VDDAFLRSRDHGEHAAAVLVGLTQGALAVVDGRSPAVRRDAQPLILNYVREEDDVKELIAQEGKRLERSGYHAQLALGEDSGIFLVENGVRKNVTRELRPMLLDAVANAVERCSPGVVARNLVQDAVLKPTAVVLGPAEIAYRAQMSGLYGRFGVPMPIPLPRLTATLVPPTLADLIEHAGVSMVETMLREPPEFVRWIYERSLPSALRDAARELEMRVIEAVDSYSSAVEAGAPPKVVSRVKSRLSDLKSRTALVATSTSDVGKAIALERWPFLSDFASLVKAGGKPQERTLSALVPFLFGGAPAARDLHRIATGHVDDLLDGRTSHIVYSLSL